MFEITLQELTSQLETNKTDSSLWFLFLSETIATKSTENIRMAYEKLLEQFPTSSIHWVEYLEFEDFNEQYEKMEIIFTKCLTSVFSVNLWKCYLNYIRKINSLKFKLDQEESREIITKAFDFVLSNIGFDPFSSSIWSDYINFIKIGKVFIVIH